MDTDSNAAPQAPSADPSGVATSTVIAVADLSPGDPPRATRTSKWTKLQSIEIQNFKTIQTIRVPLSSVTVLVGPNGSGKSSILQAIHWAARAASYISPRNTKEVIAFERLDYMPASDPLKTAYRSELASDTNSKPMSVAFEHAVGQGEPSVIATVKIWAARNKAGISAHIEGGAAVTPFKQRVEFITAYIPGLAGLSEKETILAQPLLRRQAASGDAGGVLRNVLFNLASRQPSEDSDEAAVHRLGRLNQLLQSIHPGVTISVGFDEREDVNIQANFRDTRMGAANRPLEAAATGVLQVAQIFAYIIHFRPKLLLIDEPDAHLHPDKQERLIEALEQASAEFDAQVIITTHSPSIVRATSPKVKLVWLGEGQNKTDDDHLIRRMMGWGGLDKKCIFFVEDAEDKAIRALLRQWPELNRHISICRCFGVENLPRNRLLEGLASEGELAIHALVHRDRDFMTDEECTAWSRLYDIPNTSTWCTKFVDVEAYFCEPSYLATLYSVPEVSASLWVSQAAANVTQARDKFFEKRKAINALLHRDGGSPESQSLWDLHGGQCAQTVLGKRLLAALKPVVKTAGYDDSLLNALTIPSSLELAVDLREALSRAIRGAQ
jgi:predicted ATPase